MPKKSQKLRFNTEKDIAEGTDVKGAPLVGGEFIIPDAKDGEIGQGQTVEVQSDTKLEKDTGTGPAVILRTFEFGVNPIAFKEHQKTHGRLPYAQELFESHIRGIRALLWQDGLEPIEEIQPRVIFSKEGTKYFIVLGTQPQIGQAIVQTPQTLTEIIHDQRRNPDKVSRKL